VGTLLKKLAKRAIMLWYLAGSYLILLEVPNHNFAKKKANAAGGLATVF
jgi:hypothetical protein